MHKKPSGRPRFILDVHLGKLAKKLRMLGFDTLYENNYADMEVVEIALSEKRIIATRDIGLLKIKKVLYGYWIRSQKPNNQLLELINYFDLSSKLKPFYRCMECNGIIRRVKKEHIIDQLQFRTKKYYDEFYQCEECKNLYWKGSHYYKMEKFVESLRKEY